MTTTNTTTAMLSEAEECLQSLIANYDDLREACEAKERRYREDRYHSYADNWKQTIEALDRMKAQAESAIEQKVRSPAAAAQPDLEELRRAICGIRVVGDADGHEVIRRESVIDLIDQRRNAAAQEGKKEDALLALQEVGCDLHYLFGRASLEGHEAGQALANRVQAKMRGALDGLTDGQSVATAAAPSLPAVEAEPCAWMNESGSNIIHKETKERLLESKGLGGEFSVAARTAERYTVPLYRHPASAAPVVPQDPPEKLIEAMTLAYERSPCHDLTGPMEDAYRALVAYFAASQPSTLLSDSGITDGGASKLSVSYPQQPPCTNDYVADGCEKFQE
jgi:hypothetical protein